LDLYRCKLIKSILNFEFLCKAPSWRGQDEELVEPVRGATGAILPYAAVKTALGRTEAVHDFTRQREAGKIQTYGAGESPCGADSAIS
jgi:hypothetical protein